MKLRNKIIISSIPLIVVVGFLAFAYFYANLTPYGELPRVENPPGVTELDIYPYGVPETTRGTTLIQSGDSFSIQVELDNESLVWTTFDYTDTVHTNCITKTYQTNEFLYGEIIDPQGLRIGKLSADVRDGFYVCKLGLKEGVRDLRVIGEIQFNPVLNGNHTLIITNPQNSPVEVSYRILEEKVNPNTG